METNLVSVQFRDIPSMMFLSLLNWGSGLLGDHVATSEGEHENCGQILVNAQGPKIDSKSTTQ